MKLGDLIFLPTKSGRYRQYKVLSWHPEFSAVTCTVNGGYPLIRSAKNFITQEQNEDRIKAGFRKKLEEKYKPLIRAAEHGADWKSIKAAFPCEYPCALWNRWQACRRNGLIKIV